MGEQQWVSVARELAGVVRRAAELERERTELAVARERLERSLADLLHEPPPDDTEVQVQCHRDWLRHT